MKKTPTQPDKISAPAAATGVPANPDAEARSSREMIEDTLGGALTRVLARAGLDLRVVPKPTPAGPAAAVLGAAPVPGGEPPAAAKAVLPARDELITLLTLVIGSQLLQRHAADPGADRADAVLANPPAESDRHGNPPWLAAQSPPVTGPALPARPLPRSPVASPAPSPAPAKAAAVPPKGRGFTIRY